MQKPGCRDYNNGNEGFLADAFSVSNLRIMVDVVDWNAITESFREAIGERWEAVRGE